MRFLLRTSSIQPSLKENMLAELAGLHFALYVLLNARLLVAQFPLSQLLVAQVFVARLFAQQPTGVISAATQTNALTI